MNTYNYNGGCHCGNITFTMVLTNEANSYSPRACDCDFCRKHNASYLSDRNGEVTITVKEESKLGKYRQGSGIADFLLCKRCGVLVGVRYTETGHVYAAINSKAVDKGAGFGEELVISPRMLDDNEKIRRWKEAWFSNVGITVVGT